MSFIKNHTYQQVIFIGLIFFYVLFFVNLITDDRSSLSLIYIPIALLLLYFSKHKALYLHPNIVIIGLSSVLLITLNEYFFHPHESTIDEGFNYQAKKYISQFLYFMPLIFLGTLFKFSNFNTYIFKKIIFGCFLFALLFNSYLNLQYHFDRSLLISYFSAIILYDYCMISLGLIALIFSFKLKPRLSFFFIGLSLLHISMIVLHGTRGAWIGIPIALTLISIYFYKTHLKQIIFMLITAILLTISMFIAPNSPLISRMDNLQSDTALMEKNNYNSSVGTRFALWHFAIDEFKRSPINGHGIVNFRNDVCAPSNQAEVPNCQPHAHNIVFQELASHGLLGLINLLILVLIPLIYFIKNCRNQTNQQTSLFAFTGLVTLIYLGICGMSDYLFFLSFPTMFTFLMILTLMNLIHIENIKDKEQALQDI